jgi:hypothetical protein
MMTRFFTQEDIENCWGNNTAYFICEILNGNYKVEEARDDLGSLIGSKDDKRISKKKRAK